MNEATLIGVSSSSCEPSGTPVDSHSFCQFQRGRFAVLGNHPVRLASNPNPIDLNAAPALRQKRRILTPVTIGDPESSE
jgi:hypothetical protein